MLSDDGLRLSEVCRRTTGSFLPPTHSRGSVPIDAGFSTAGLICSAVTLLPGGEGVGDHRMFVFDIESDSLLGDVFPHVLPAASRLLNCASDRIKQNYIRVLNQLTSRHHIFRKLLTLSGDNTQLTTAQLQLRLNKVDEEMEQFMKSSERDCHKYKRSDIEWSPLVGVWLRRRWLLHRVQTFREGRTRDPRNLI